ncbi:MAG: transposase [Oscillospiraceae bacterium]|nr:transposase [Oscillospiraceae bacterium]
MEYPKRKPNRLPEFDYSTAAAYFITICTDQRKNRFWHEVGAIIDRPQSVPLNEAGCIAEYRIKDIEQVYRSVSVDHYVIMPNHIHMLLQIRDVADGRSMIAPTVSTIVRHMKGYVSKRSKERIWQKGFYDHVIRTETDYAEIWNDIETNPIKWTADKFYSDEGFT